MINECGEWDWNRLHALLPDEILRRFAAKRSPMMEWLFANITDAEQLALDPDNWACMFEALCWCLWKQRNSRIFIQGHVDQDNVINGARQLCSVQAAVSQNQSRCH
ncbi:hypothetical protein Gogos_000261, partial [Gossypium gossypioides]|nr:hypothetical protein [Gossypium gossypioides]